MNVDGVKSPHNMAHFLGITPTRLKINQHPPKTRYISDIIQGILFISIFLLTLTYFLYGAIFTYGREVHTTVIITFTLMEIVTTLVNIQGIYQLNLRHGLKVQKFLKKLQKLEVFIIETEKIAKENWRCWLEFYSMGVFSATFACLSGYVYVTTLGWDVYKYSILRELQNAHVGIVIEIVTRYYKLISLRMNELNQHLQNIVLNNRIVYIASTSDILLKQNVEKLSVNGISEAYTTITELIDECNTFSGAIFLVYFGSMVLNILVPINMALLFVQNIEVYANHNFGPLFFVFCVLWVIFPCVSKIIKSIIKINIIKLFF